MGGFEIGCSPAMLGVDGRYTGREPQLRMTTAGLLRAKSKDENTRIGLPAHQQVTYTKQQVAFSVL